MKQGRRSYYFLIIFALVNLFGTLGYTLLLDINVLDAMYMTVITVSTVGFGEVAPLTPLAKGFTIILIFISLGFIGYAGTQLVNFFFEGEIRNIWRDRKLKDKLDHLKDHVIVCGAGETGRHVIDSLHQENVSFVVIEQNEEKVEFVKEDKVIAFVGDATTDEALERAGIRRAKGLVAALSTDANNLYTVLTAREINPNLTIVARAINHNSHDKLIRAGANKTVSPNEIGGHRMASMLLKPSVIAFLDTITHSGKIDLNLNQVVIKDGSHLSNKTLQEAHIPEKTDLIIIAIKEEGEDDIIFNPKKDYPLRPNQTLIVLGEDEDLDKLKHLAEDK
ncbi:voltage-gated potassium channel [Streptohalobacillus salinus]|uniref:Voltage-gated potassium channel n=1 Tax=Streptohalobacillus salinus TaxID=621096 RepID=A0A2V3WA90_9BACI|nr:potassium channel protein [Streptohalobacillus salinus]PXW90990.1 voltage-gated potassium channel [Streptohalobacillus salinus]